MDWRGEGVSSVRNRAFAALFALLLLASPATTALGAGDVSFTGEVRLSGQPASNGTAFSYDLADLDSASTPTVEFTGETATEWDNETSAGVSSGSSLDLSVAGDQDPTGPSANGEPVVELTGTEQTTSWSTSSTGATSGSTKSVTVPGNVDPDAETVEFTGREQKTARTISQSNLGNGDSFSYSVGGNVDATDASVTFNGDSSTTTGSVSATGVSPSHSTSISVGGNVDPVGPSSNNRPTLQITGHNGYGPELSVSNDNGYTTPDDYNGMRIDALTAANGVRVRIAPDTEDPQTAYLWDSNEDVLATKDISDKSSGDYVTLEAQLNSGEKYYVIMEANGNVDDLGRHDTSNTEVRVDGGYAGPDHETGNGQAEVYAYDSISLLHSPTGVSASADDGTTVSFGDMSDGETRTKEFDISKSASTVTIDADLGRFDYSLDWTERTATEDPSIDVDGDGSTDASYTGVLISGETHTASVSTLSTGSHTASVSTGHQVDVDIGMTERTASEDPGLDLDGDGVTDASYSGILTSGETASVSADTLSEGSTTLETSLTAGSVDYTVSATGRTHTENPSVDLDGDGSTEVSHSGIISPGTTETYELTDLSTSTSSATISTAAGTTDVAFRFKERQRSVDPAVIINGNRAGYTGTLDDGQTVQVDGSSSWLSSGDNTVEVRVGEGVSSDAPTPQVQMVYTHDATDRINQTYTDETWSERYNVEKQFNASQNDVTVDLEHSSEIVAVRSLEYRVNGGSWQDLTSQAYELNGTTVQADIGDFQAGDTVEVRDAASKVQVHNGGISVEEPTAPGQRLDTAVRMDSWSSDSYIKVRNSSDLVRYTYNESWSAPDEYVDIYATGEQRLYMPGASAGSLARVSTIPVEVDAETGGARVSVEDPTRSEPEFVVDPGPGGSGDTVAFTYLNAQDDTEYVLWSATEEIVRDSGTANSPITLTNDDSDETLAFLIDDTGSSGPTNSSGSTGIDDLTGAAQGAVGSTSLGDVGIIIVVAVVIAGAWVISRQFGDANLGWQTLFVAEAVVGGVLALELLSQYSLAGGIAVGIARFLEGVGLGLAEAMPLALIVLGGLGYLAVRRWGRPQVVVNRTFSLGGSERGENRK